MVVHTMSTKIEDTYKYYGLLRLDSYMYESENFSDLEGFSEPQH